MRPKRFNRIRGTGSALRWAMTGLLVLFCANTWAQPFAVTTSTTIENDNWYPLPARDMKAAAADTALAELSKGGYFRFVQQGAAAPRHDAGLLKFEISLIGPAETAKLTITLQVPDKPTYVSSASISVRGMDYQGIYNAFEHIGTVSAKRLNTKLAALLETKEPARHTTRTDPNAGKSDRTAEVDDPRVKAEYERAQRLKHEQRFEEAKVAFERVAAASGPGTKKWVTLARDELRYGLPLFEAKQWLIKMGSPGNDPATLRRTQRKAENLFRQILAENTDSLQRTQEAQRYLDELAVTRAAIDNALRASSLSRATHLRIYLLQYYAEYGECPGRQAMEGIVKEAPAAFEIMGYQRSADQANLKVRDPETQYILNITCSARGIQLSLN